MFGFDKEVNLDPKERKRIQLVLAQLKKNAKNREVHSLASQPKASLSLSWQRLTSSSH